MMRLILVALLLASTAYADCTVGTVPAQVAQFDYSSLPAAGSAGRLVYVTDRQQVWVDTGTAWVPTQAAQPIATAVASRPVDGTDGILLCNATGGPVTLTLPAALAGRTYVIKKIDATANHCIVQGTAGDTIDGEATQEIIGQYNSMSVVYDGSDWFIW
jgi:hypothetical protein